MTLALERGYSKRELGMHGIRPMYPALPTELELPGAERQRPGPFRPLCGPESTGLAGVFSLPRGTVLIAIVCIVGLQNAAWAQNLWPNVDGLWRTDGYGEMLELRQNTLQIYEVTSTTCVPAGKAKKRPKSGSGEIVFEGGTVGTLRMTASDDPGTLWLHNGGVSGIALQRAPALPNTCGHQVSNTPESNYEVFWRTFSEQYPFFILRKIDWSAVDKRFRPQVNANTSSTDLFKMLQQMIEPLFDAHTGIDAKNIREHFDGYLANTEPQQGKRAVRIREIIQKIYIRGELHNYCHELTLGAKPQSLFHFGLVGDSIGYLRIDEFPEHCEGELDRIFRAASELKGLIIDERLNVGGSDAFGIALASRLTDHEYLAYSKVARNDVNDGGQRTSPQSVIVHPSSRPGFSGEVALLIGKDSVSAAETFAMALFGREPHVTRLGENTQGVFSDVLERRLPNGWLFRLPNEIYLAENGKAFDVSGVPPDVRLPVFPDQDLKAGRDGVLEEAIELLKRASKNRP
jgi:hypothetical protein